MATTSSDPTSSASVSTWQIDPAASRVEFAIHKRLLFVPLTVHGSFPDLSGTIMIDEANLHASRVEATITTTGITTGLTRRDEHLRGADFFDVERYPTLRFQSERVEASDAAQGSGRLLGRLTIRDRTRPLALDLAFAPTTKLAGATRLQLTATATLNRRDFGLTWNTPWIGIGDTVRITLRIEATPPAPAASTRTRDV